MAAPKLPSGGAGSLSYLAFSTVCLYKSGDFPPHSSGQIISYILSAAAFVIALLDYKPFTNLFSGTALRSLLPWPCKHNCSSQENRIPICIRDIGFMLGSAISLLIFINAETLSSQIPNNIVYTGIVIAIFVTIIHGTLRRTFNIFKDHHWLTGIVGFVTGLGVYFVAVLFERLL